MFSPWLDTLVVSHDGKVLKFLFCHGKERGLLSFISMFWYWIWTNTHESASFLLGKWDWKQTQSWSFLRFLYASRFLNYSIDQKEAFMYLRIYDFVTCRVETTLGHFHISLLNRAFQIPVATTKLWLVSFSFEKEGSTRERNLAINTSEKICLLEKRAYMVLLPPKKVELFSFEEEGRLVRRE